MDKQAVKKRRSRRADTRYRNSERNSKRESTADRTYDIKGIVKVILTKVSQRAVGCVLGEDITPENPWIFIPKEKLEDNMFLHEESSEFLPIRNYILNYPEEEMLIGFDKLVNEDQLEYYVCSNIAAKNAVMRIIEQHRIEMQEKLAKSICKYPRYWNSLGSEECVDLGLIKNLRPLVELIYDTKYPLYTEEKQFKLRLVEDAIDGYVELLPGRYPISNVYRKRVDSGTQVTPPTVDRDSQTTPHYPKNVWTQYNYEYDVPKLNPAAEKNLVKFMMEQVNSLSDTIHVNEHINLFTDDYMKIAKEVEFANIFVDRDIVSFREVVTCTDIRNKLLVEAHHIKFKLLETINIGLSDIFNFKGKLVSDVALDPFTSGLLAASYTRAPFNSFYTSANTEDEVYDTIFGTHLVLIWSNSNCHKPKLYLHSYREVNIVKYCPYRPNIIVGGCTNGQIVIWDIKGKLQQVETIEILTPTEMSHRHIIHSLMTWSKNTYKSNVVYPIAVSTLDHSHRDVVTEILYVLPYYEINKYGKIKKLEEGQESFQVISCGLEGKILVWNFLRQEEKDDAPRVKKSDRLQTRPSILEADISEYKYLQNNLSPVYKLKVKDMNTSQLYPITNASIKNNNAPFKLLNPDTINDPFQRSYFKALKPSTSYEFTPEIKLADKLGHVFLATFTGLDFEQGQTINYENCKLTVSAIYHDGPVRNLILNPNDENFILSIGGRVFAIWDVRDLQRPLFWRKCNKRYISGSWSSSIPGAVVIARADSYFETWDILERTKAPERLLRIGSPMNDSFSVYSTSHVDKYTYITTDVAGAVRIYRLPFTATSISNKLIRKASYLRHRIFDRRKQREAWLEVWRKKHGFCKTDESEEKPLQMEVKQVEPVEAKDTEKEKVEEKVPKKKKADKKGSELIQGNKWHVKEEQHMHEVLLQKANLNLAEIEKNKIPFRKLVAKQHQTEEKIVEILAEKEKIFEAAKWKVFKEGKYTAKKGYKVSFPEKFLKAMKECYIEQYEEAVGESFQFIKKNLLSYAFDWSHMISRGIERKRAMVAGNLKYDYRKRHKARKKGISVFIAATSQEETK